MRTTKYKELLILLNKVLGLEGCGGMLYFLKVSKELSNEYVSDLQNSV